MQATATTSSNNPTTSTAFRNGIAQTEEEEVIVVVKTPPRPKADPPSASQMPRELDLSSHDDDIDESGSMPEPKSDKDSQSQQHKGSSTRRRRRDETNNENGEPATTTRVEDHATTESDSSSQAHQSETNPSAPLSSPSTTAEPLPEASGNDNHAATPSGKDPPQPQHHNNNNPQSTNNNPSHDEDNDEAVDTSNHQLRVNARRTRTVAKIREPNNNDTTRSGATAKRKRNQSSDGATAITTTTTPTTTRSSSSSSKKKTLPRNQYETTLVRRAVRKGEAPPQGSASSSHDETVEQASSLSSSDTVLELYGDVSLGMQLTPVGGKIIVQGLIPLKDGRASPAQMSGCIQRGDVLLQINHRSLVNIPFDQLMVSLTPLSSPMADGTYPRRITLRFAAGQGLDMLQRRQVEEQSALRHRKGMAAGGGSDPASTSSWGGGAPSSASQNNAGSVDGAADILGLFTMVDHLSGMPMFPEDHSSLLPLPPEPKPPPEPASPELLLEPASAEPRQEETRKPEATPASTAEQLQQQTMPLEEAISHLIAEERYTEQEQCNSDFFSWNDALSPLLRQPLYLRNNNSNKTIKDSANTTATSETDDGTQTKTDLLELGHQAFQCARKLSAILEKIDRGWSDRRSFHSLSATLSLYSKASTRRRYVLDSKAMPINFEQLQEESENSVAVADGGENDSEAGSNEEELDGDELLLQLAAQDEIWRKQVIEFLGDVEKKLNKPDENNSPNASPDLDDSAASAVSSELGSFLFGDRMTKALMLHKKPQALPPDEITALLFDLATNVSATVPDQIQAAGSSATFRSPMVPFISMKTPSADSNVMLAARFLLDDVLPVWLKTFRPLPWDQRRVLWPLEKSHPAESTVGSTRSDDSMTIDSMNTRQTTSTKRKSSKGLREQIEDQELNVETRAETCFLATFYFTQKLLPNLVRGGGGSPSRKGVDEKALQLAKSFVNEYGAYLRLHTCIAYAAVLRAQDIIKVLLLVGTHDPMHRESLRRFSKPSGLFFYEPTTLSAVVERLHNLRRETNPEQRLVTIQLCSSAYPDVRPWQVDRECRGLFRNGPTNTKDQEKLKQLYYKYLTYLLHPSDGHEATRHDSALVMEWSELSVRGYMDKESTPEAQEYKKNFFSVASKASSDHLAYKRDLTALLRLSMDAREFLLALDLATEILDDPHTAKKKSLFLSMMSTLRTIGFATTESFQPTDTTGKRTLKRIFRLFQRANGMELSNGDVWVVDVPAELSSLLNHATEAFGAGEQSRLASLLNFFSNEAAPKELLMALASWSSSVPKLESDLYRALRTILRRGANDNENVVELSGCLRRVRNARSDLTADPPDSSSHPPSQPTGGGGLWKKKVNHGLLTLAK